MVAHGTPGTTSGTSPRCSQAPAAARNDLSPGCPVRHDLRVFPGSSRMALVTGARPSSCPWTTTDANREPRADRRLDTGPRDHRDAAARARRPGAPPAAPERLGQGDRGGSRRARRELRRQLARRAVPVRPGVRGDRVAGLDAARHRDRRLRAAVDLRPARGHRRLPRGTADGAVPAHRPGHRGAAAPRGRRGDRRAARRLARLARPADRPRGAAVSVRRRSWRTAVGRPVRTGRHASCRAASRLRRVTGGVARATPASRTLAARLARPRDRAARGRHRGDRCRTSARSTSASCATRPSCC